MTSSTREPMSARTWIGSVSTGASPSTAEAFTTRPAASESPVSVARPAASVVAFLVDHYSWFSHLGDPYVAPLPFVNSPGFFTLFVWLVPFSLFVSLSINDNELPLGRPEAPRSSTAFRRLADWIREAYAEAFRAGAQAAAPRTHDKFY